MLMKDPDKAEAPLVGLSERYEAGNISSHAHQRAQIVYAVEGSMTVLTDRGSWVLPPNRALWLPARTQHALTVRRPIELRTLYLDEAARWLPTFEAISVLQIVPLTRELILAAVEMPWDYRPGSTHARLARVLCDRLIISPVEPVHLPEPRDARAKRLTALYYADPAERRSLASLAPLTGASVRTLERLFVNETGYSVGAWVQQLRLIFALEKIADGAPVGDAAFDVGFKNPSSFIAVFRQQFGTTPARFFKGNIGQENASRFSDQSDD